MASADITPLYLEDLSVGDEIHCALTQITAEEIIDFAKEFDPQPFHTDPEAAKSTIFKGLAASGWHTVALTMRMLVDGALPIAGGVIGLGIELSWPRPTRPGDLLSVECEIMDIIPSSSKPNQALILARATTTNQNGETVLVLNSKNLAFKRGHLPTG